jgi:hypothetical protein
MTTMEALPAPTWSERQRDRLEAELATKRELISERRYGLEIIIYWLKQTNAISMDLILDNDVRAGIEVPADKVLDARDHPEAYANLAGQPRQLKRWYETDK